MVRPSVSAVWNLAERQHGVVSRAQLLGLGLSGEAIKHRLARRRLHPIFRGVYVVGRPELTDLGRWMAAVLSCGSGAGLSHGSAAAHWAVGQERPGQIEISVPAAAKHRRPGILVHRRGNVIRHHMTEHQGIPITSPALTLVDLATRLAAAQLERAINEADKRSLIDPEALRAALGSMPMMPGIAALRRVLDHRVFRLTDSELERRFLRLVRRAGLPLPKTGWTVNGFRVDFYWPDLGLVVEADGLRYHRTPAQQTRDRLRDQAHTAAGMIPLRFTHAQIAFEPDHVQATLCAVADGVRRRGLSRARSLRAVSEA